LWYAFGGRSTGGFQPFSLDVAFFPKYISIDFFDRLHWHSLVWAVWEALMVVGVRLGSPALFRQRMNRQRRLAEGLAASSS
jgi:hypothetical protein